MTTPSETQIAKLMSLPAELPLAVLNLFQFNVKACYSDADPEFGTPAGEVTGAEAFARYGEVAGKLLEECGGRVVFSEPIAQVMIGAEDVTWDVAALMFFPTRRDFTRMLGNPEFVAVSRHRRAALANHYMLHLAGDSFLGLGG